MKLPAICLIVSVGLASAKDWWEGGNFYQIYPRSFKDSDGDGIGDLNGIASKLEYLKEIGMDGVWLSPIFKSPMVDFGYDTEDYRVIHPEYGTMEDFDNLIKEAKRIGIKIILDFVPNHTSDQSEWFKKSVDAIPPYDDYYVWNDGILNTVTNKRDPPSNWLSAFRYSSWEWNEVRQQYYLHQFAIQQPDLNYRSPHVVKEMKEVLKFWMAKGVSGFRIDAIPFMFEVEPDPITGGYPNEPHNSQMESCTDPNDHCYLQHIYTQDQPETYDMIYQWREMCEQFKKDHGGDTRVLMTEAYTSLPNIVRYYGNGQRNGSHIPFNFELITKVNGMSTAKDFNDRIQDWMDAMPNDKRIYPNWVMGNHDNKRLASRYKNRADLINMLLQTLPGIAVTYYGEEIGMENKYIDWEHTMDPQACNADETRFDDYSRDPARTPFQWDSSTSAGFSTNEDTWLPVHEDYKKNNILLQKRAPVSHLQVFKKLTKVRREPSFREGSCERKVIQNDDILIYKREKPGSDKYVVILNFSSRNHTINIKEYFTTISNKVEIITTSVESPYTDGEVVDATRFNAQGNVGTVIVSL